VNNQIAQIEVGASIQRVALVLVTGAMCISLVIFAVWQWQASDPYIKEVLSLQGRVEQGQEIFQMNCAACHGSQANGLVGPTLYRVSTHRSPVGLIQQVTSGKTPPMPQFQPSPQAMADLLAYLETL